MKKAEKRRELSTPGDRLRQVRALMGSTRAYFQDKYGIPEVTLKSWENGTVKLTPSAAKRCIDVYKAEGFIVSEEWILNGVGLDPTSSATINQYFSEPTNKNMPLQDDEACMIHDADVFKKTYPNAVILLVSGNEMRPFYKPGDYVGGKMRYGKNIETAVNKDCIVHLKDKSRFFRRLIKCHEGSYNLTCLNPNEDVAEPVMYDVKIEGVAPIIWHRWRDD